MGIKGLRSRLQPFARFRPLDATSVIVDGPGLAYYLLSLHMREDQSALYHTKCLVKSLFQWLALLKKHNVKIEALYFDGSLPDEKLPVRMQREVVRCQRSFDFFDAHPKGCPLPVVCPDDKFVDPLSPPCPSSITPVTPFVVAAILEALAESPGYHDRVFVVPGEADIYCATHAALGTNISVLSGDSDLVVHKLGTCGGLVYFSDLEERNDGSSLVCLRYEAHTIEREMGLPSGSLVKFSYELLKFSQASTRSIAKRVLQQLDLYTSPEFLQFAEPYKRTIDLSVARDSISHSHVFLDARISETVLQHLESRCDDGQPPRHFLPALVDSTFDFSAWIPSLPLRQITYSLLPLLNSHTLSEVREFRRTVQISSKGTAVDILSLDELIVMIDAVYQCLPRVESPSLEALLMTVLTLEVEHASSLDRIPLSFKMISSNQMVIDGPQQLVSWPLMHFKAQVEACIYSLRMLQQVLIYGSSMGLDEKLPGQVQKQLSQIILVVPKLTDIPKIPEIERFFLNLPSQQLKGLCSRYGLREPCIKLARTRKSQPGKKRVHKTVSSFSSHQKGKPSFDNHNLFNNLN